MDGDGLDSVEACNVGLLELACGGADGTGRRCQVDYGMTTYLGVSDIAEGWWLGELFKTAGRTSSEKRVLYLAGKAAVLRSEKER